MAFPKPLTPLSVAESPSPAGGEGKLVIFDPTAYIGVLNWLKTLSYPSLPVAAARVLPAVRLALFAPVPCR